MTVKEGNNMQYNKIHNFYSQIKEKFGDNGIWLALFVIMLYDNSNHKFPDYLKEYPQTKEIVEFLEQDELSVQMFINAAKETGFLLMGEETNELER